MPFAIQPFSKARITLLLVQVNVSVFFKKLLQLFHIHVTLGTGVFADGKIKTHTVKLFQLQGSKPSVFIAVAQIDGPTIQRSAAAETKMMILPVKIFH